MQIVRISSSIKSVVASALLLILSQFLLPAEGLAAGSKKSKKLSAQEKERRERAMTQAKENEIAEEDTVTSKVNAQRKFLALGIRFPTEAKMVDLESIYNGHSRPTKTERTLEQSPGFTLEVWNIKYGFFGFNVGGYYEPAKKIESYSFIDPNHENDLVLNSSVQTEFTQYGAMLNMMVAGEIPYFYFGVNYGGGELNFKDSDFKAPKVEGALGGQVGLGLILADLVAVEGTHSLSHYAIKEKTAYVDFEKKVRVTSTMVSVKILLH